MVDMIRICGVIKNVIENLNYGLTVKIKLFYCMKVMLFCYLKITGLQLKLRYFHV